MDRILIILKKENRSRASSALTLGLNTIILKHVYWYTYMQQISGERLQDHWSSGLGLGETLMVHLLCYKSYALTLVLSRLVSKIADACGFIRPTLVIFLAHLSRQAHKVSL